MEAWDQPGQAALAIDDRMLIVFEHDGRIRCFTLRQGGWYAEEGPLEAKDIVKIEREKEAE